MGIGDVSPVSGFGRRLSVLAYAASGNQATAACGWRRRSAVHLLITTGLPAWSARLTRLPLSTSLPASAGAGGPAFDPGAWSWGGDGLGAFAAARDEDAGDKGGNQRRGDRKRDDLRLARAAHRCPTSRSLLVRSVRWRDRGDRCPRRRVRLIMRVRLITATTCPAWRFQSERASMPTRPAEEDARGADLRKIGVPARIATTRRKCRSGLLGRELRGEVDRLLPPTSPHLMNPATTPRSGLRS
jgi:hypothetical protein